MARAEKTREYRTIPDRKVKRKLARFNMKKKGFTDKKLKEINKQTGRTFFAENWKNYCTLEDK